MANSDAKALRRYLLAVGVDLPADRLNDLLVLLAVLMIEVGGGLSLAVGMALDAPPARLTPAGAPVRQAPATQPLIRQPEQPKPAATHSPDATYDASANAGQYASVQLAQTVRPSFAGCRTLQGHPSDVVQWLTLKGGKALTSMRRLASDLKRSPSGVHDELRRLVACGAITMTCGPRGTAIALRPN